LATTDVAAGIPDEVIRGLGLATVAESGNSHAPGSTGRNAATGSEAYGDLPACTAIRTVSIRPRSTAAQAAQRLGMNANEWDIRGVRIDAARMVYGDAATGPAIASAATPARASISDGLNAGVDTDRRRRPAGSVAGLAQEDCWLAR
jgi:hypothetical protein